ncbi:hypothetical protein L873DRAFT_1811861 [Choiromyces venosus 120613-1]|uniref:Uncharacterized protein n=1 Tax=Choiromyces venosus 120613-1 TaxID=1336337 RepID=A0A3N4JFI6_9PEZI|nr:hypothetical protein L873DRAFT_1811861 [Choiromyces venosus 120613-1]
MPLTRTHKYPLHCVLKKKPEFSPKLIPPHSWVSPVPIYISIHIPHLTSSFLSSANFNLASSSLPPPHPSTQPSSPPLSLSYPPVPLSHPENLLDTYPLSP